MMKLALALAMAPAAMANHLTGPMQDALDACNLEKCPVGYENWNDNSGPFFDEFGISINTFLSPPYNNNQIIGDPEYILKVLGYTGAGAPTDMSFKYTKLPNSQVDVEAVAEGCDTTEGTAEQETAEATACTLTVANAAACPAVAGSCAKSAGSGTCTYRAPVAPVTANANPCPTGAEATCLTMAAGTVPDNSAHMLCGCTNCAAQVEAIFQPSGRSVCATLGLDLPCKTEEAACTAKYPDDTAGWDATAWKIDSTCQPEKAKLAYKSGYKLGEKGTCLGDKPEVKALQECLAASRHGAIAEHDGPERCFVTESDPVGAAATACTLTAADAAACPAVAGSCAKSAGDGSCTYIKAVASTDPNLGGLKDICPAKASSARATAAGGLALVLLAVQLF